MSLLSKRVHILGLGNLGRFFAHSLQLSDKIAPISLLFHRESLFTEWDAASARIRITSSDLNSSTGTTTTASSTYDLEPTFTAHPADSLIHNLIVTTKTYKTLEALGAIRDRLTADTTILFVQNGLGVIPTINGELFPDPATRPHYLAALVSHGLFSLGPFESVHAGQGGTVLGHVSPPSSRTSYLVERVMDAAALNVAYYDREDLWNFQLEKLVINAIINPLTTLFRCPNGQLLWVGIPRKPVKLLMKRMLVEIHNVLLTREGQEGIIDPDRFTLSNMEISVSGTAKKTRKNVCSMLQDVLNGSETEIDAINGWVVTEGERAGVDVRVNKRVIELVKEKKEMCENDIEIYFPGTLSREEMELWNQQLEDLRQKGPVTAKKRLYNEQGVCVQAW